VDPAAAPSDHSGASQVTTLTTGVGVHIGGAARVSQEQDQSQKVGWRGGLPVNDLGSLGLPLAVAHCQASEFGQRSARAAAALASSEIVAAFSSAVSCQAAAGGRRPRRSARTGGIRSRLVMPTG
jgi:hypothetical protein